MHAFQDQNKFWKGKSRLKWLVDGDGCSKFFHTFAKVRAANSTIHSLSINDAMVDDQAISLTHIVNYFEDLYSTNSPTNQSSEVLSFISCLVSTQNNHGLVQIPSSIEIKKAIFSLDPNSALGLDGFPSSFYQDFWDLVFVDMVNFIQVFFRNSWLSKNLNSNFVVLIPKLSGACRISQFRPIALANFCFKIIVKF